MPLVLGAVLAASAACSPLRQPLGSLTAAGTTGSGGGSGSTMAGVAGSAGAGPLHPTGNQIPVLPPEWESCDPNAFRCFRDPAVPASPPVSGLFSGSTDPDPANKPAVVYPLAGSMHPINLADITFQWRHAPAAARTIYRIRLRRINSDAFEFFVPCQHATTPDTSQCVYHMPPGAWIDTATTAHGETLTVDVAAFDPSRPGVVATSDPMTISFSPEDVRGGFYYWSNKLVGTSRVLFGERQAQPFIVAKTSSNPQTCGGCHAVSRSGSTIAFTEGSSADQGVLRVAATSDADQALFPEATMHDSGTLALNHDGTRVVVSFGGRLFLRDATTGAQIAEVSASSIPSPLKGYHPDWSPDDKSIALTLSSQGASDWSVGNGAIGVLPVDLAATGSAIFGAVETLVDTSAAAFNFYPAFSPDGHWIAFATAPPGMNQTSYKQANARLRLVNRDTREVFELTNATQAMGRQSTWPKFAPMTQAGGLMFLTFNSKIDYGFYVSNGSVGQMWLTAIDVRKLPGGDASTPPVWLPFQDVTTFNYLGAWSEHVGCRVDAAGASIGCGDGQICAAGACVMVGP